MNLFNIVFPRTILEYHTPYAQEELIQTLNEYVESKKNIRRVDIPQEHKRFEGTIAQDRFEIRPVPSNGNIHVCRISGEIHPENKGTRLLLRLGTPKSYVFTYLLFPVIVALFFAAFPFENVPPGFAIQVYASVIFGILFVLMFPYFIGKRVKKAQEETRVFFDHFFNEKE